MGRNKSTSLKKSPKTDITVFIPTYNAAAYLREILEAIYGQVIDKNFEVLIIDSGSTDETLDIIKDFPDVRLHKIPNSEFGHGRTRQLAAEMAKGEIIAYLSHDATPFHDRWLYEITKPFEIHERIAGVTGKQFPRQHCAPIMKYDINAVFRQLGPDFGTTLFYEDTFIDNPGVYDAVRFYSDVNSAARKSILLGEVPYRDVAYAEDQLFGEDLLKAGYIKVYASRGSVIHSNDVSLKDYNKRIFDEVLGLKSAGASPDNPGTLRLLKNIARDSIRILLDPQYSIRRKAYWVVVNPMYHIQKYRGTKQALNTGVNDPSISRKSLEHQQKNKI